VCKDCEPRLRGRDTPGQHLVMPRESGNPLALWFGMADSDSALLLHGHDVETYLWDTLAHRVREPFSTNNRCRSGRGCGTFQYAASILEGGGAVTVRGCGTAKLLANNPYVGSMGMPRPTHRLARSVASRATW
jgi:hypothetical protein